MATVPDIVVFFGSCLIDATQSGIYLFLALFMAAASLASSSNKWLIDHFSDMGVRAAHNCAGRPTWLYVEINKCSPFWVNPDVITARLILDVFPKPLLSAL